MGGRAFTSEPNPLNVIRICDAQYVDLCKQYQALLLTFYERAVVPPTAPEKLDHGDIDVLVDTELPGFSQEKLKQTLGAVRFKQAGGITSFAMPTPGDEEEYFQLDIKLCKKSHFEWEKMIHSYGDLWHIVGAPVARFGLSINDTGLHLRITEIEKTHKKDSLLHLTSNPQEMMSFLGLGACQYAKGFGSLDEAFNWAVSSRLFRRRFFEKETVSDKEQRVRDRRPMYNFFVSKWLPQRSELDLRHPTLYDNEEALDRTLETTLREEALELFGKRKDFEGMLKEHREKVLRNDMWKTIAKALPLKGEELGRVMVALKQRLRWGNDPCPSISTDGSVERTPAFDARTVDEVIVPWVVKHWAEA